MAVRPKMVAHPAMGDLLGTAGLYRAVVIGVDRQAPPVPNPIVVAVGSGNATGSPMVNAMLPVTIGAVLVTAFQGDSIVRVLAWIARMSVARMSVVQVSVARMEVLWMGIVAMEIDRIAVELAAVGSRVLPRTVGVQDLQDQDLHGLVLHGLDLHGLDLHGLGPRGPALSLLVKRLAVALVMSDDSPQCCDHSVMPSLRPQPQFLLLMT